MGKAVTNWQWWVWARRGWSVHGGQLMIGFSSDSTFGLRDSVILLEMWMSGSQSQAVWVQLWWHMR